MREKNTALIGGVESSGAAEFLGKSFFIAFALIVCVTFSSPKAEAFASQDKVSTARGLAHYYMGYTYELLGQAKSAIIEYERAVQFDESNYLIHLRLGSLYARLNLLAEAEKELGLAGKLNTDDLQSHYLLALIYSTQKHYDKAADEYEFILKSFSDAEPRNIEVYGYLGQLYYSQKKYSKAIKQFEKILSYEKKNADVMYLLGSLYLEVGRENDAIQVLEKSIEVDPQHDGSLNTLGYIYAQKNQNLDLSLKLVQRALEVSPGNGAYLDSLGWVYYQKGMYEKALGIFQKANQSMKDPVIYDHLGDTCFRLNLFDQAIKYWQLSLELLPGQKAVIQKLNDAKSLQASR